MAFVLDDPIADDASAYIDTWNTEAELEKEDFEFCPLCEIPESYTTVSGNKPIAQLHKIIDDLKIENKLSPSGFIKFIAKFYNDMTRPQLLNVLHWQKKKAEEISYPIWPTNKVYEHFSKHIADAWLSRQEALRQTNIMLQRTANTCLTRDGPPNPNTIKTFTELTKLRETLNSHISTYTKELPQLGSK
jgi:hypothetical protein